MEQKNVMDAVFFAFSDRDDKDVYVQQLRQFYAENPSFVSEILVKKTSSPAFWTLAESLPLPNAVTQKRNEFMHAIVRDFENQKLANVKEALFDIMFQNNSNNSILDIKTIKERAALDKDFNEKYQKYKPLYDVLEKIAQLKDSEYTKEELGLLLNEVSKISKQLGIKKEDLAKITKDLYEEARTKMVNEIGKRISKPEDLLDGVEPQTVTNSQGQSAQLYPIKRQGEKQENFGVIIRSTNASGRQYMFEPGAMDKYVEDVQKFDYFSYSLIDQSFLGKPFIGKKRIVFGFSDIGQSELISSNSKDGQTNQRTLSKDKKVLRQEFIPVNTLIKRTDDYNELVFTKPETIKPTMVICAGPEPSDNEIAAANAFGIPLVYFDRECYQDKSIKEEQGIKSQQDLNDSAYDYNYAFDFAPMRELEIVS